MHVPNRAATICQHITNADIRNMTVSPTAVLYRNNVIAISQLIYTLKTHPKASFFVCHN